MVSGHEKKKPKVILWDQLFEFINSKEVGETIKRQDIVYHIYKGPMPSKYNGSYGTTVDNYRRMLTRLGVLKHVARGKYELKNRLKIKLSSIEVRMLVENGITI